MVKDAIGNFFRKYPTVANGISGFFVFSIGDLISQMGVDGKSIFLPAQHENRVDYNRVFGAGVFGIGLNGVFLTRYYRWLDKTFGSSKKNRVTIAKKVIVDQIVGAPICLFAFFGFSTLHQGGTLPELGNRYIKTVENKFIETWIADCTVWPLANVINFSVIPLPFRPTWIGFCQIFWNAFLSTMAFNHGREKHDVDDAADANTTDAVDPLLLLVQDSEVCDKNNSNNCDNDSGNNDSSTTSSRSSSSSSSSSKNIVDTDTTKTTQIEPKASIETTTKNNLIHVKDNSIDDARIISNSDSNGNGNGNNDIMEADANVKSGNLANNRK